MNIVRDSIKAQKKVFIAVNMELTDEEGAKFWPLYDAYEKETQKLDDQLGTLIALYAEQYETLTDDKANEFITAYTLLEKDYVTKKQIFASEMSKVIPSKKVARFLQLENKIQAVIRYDLAAKIPLVR